MERVLLVYPEFSETFWDLRHLLRILSKKSAFPPLGLLMVAAMLPKSWQKRLVDMNVCKLKDKDIEWADHVFIGAMVTQRDSAKRVVTRCKELGRPVSVGGPILEMSTDEFPDAQHLFLGETEETLPVFLSDLEAGRAKRVYSAEGFPSLANVPVPLWDLVEPKNYVSAMVQYNKGCPFRCKFCNVDKLNGRRPRSKSPEQFLCEVSAIFERGFRGPLFIASDNVMGDKQQVKEMLRQLAGWQDENRYPFTITAEADITLADDEELMRLMVRAGFKQVFLGIETPNRSSLIECDKMQNVYCRNGEDRDLAACVRTIQRHGLIPMSGFIVGFDNDPPGTFDTIMINFIQETGIAVAMPGVLQAIPGTGLHRRLEREGRLKESWVGNNTDCMPNFVPIMPIERLIQGYKKIIKIIYSPRGYYERIRNLLKNYNPAKRPKRKIGPIGLMPLIRANLWVGLLSGPKTGYYYWKSLLSTLLSRKWRAFADVVALQIYGAHFHKFVMQIQES